MDSYFRGPLWLILILFTLPHVTYNMSCPSSCMCFSTGAVKCVGYTITDIPDQLPAHTYLLLLNDTNMNVINEQSLANKRFLLRFSLTYSHLHTIHPQAFHVAPQLKSVKLSSNNLSTLPAQVFSPLTTLQQLHLDGNQLEIIAADMFDGLVGLQDLDLSRNKLADLASDVFDGLTNLTFLNLGRNFIKKLPPTIFRSLTKLRQLVIYHNELEVLEAALFDELVNLEELKIHHNQIASLPPQVFWSLRNLEILTLSSNQLQAIPEKTFYNMPKLSKLTIYNNPLLSLPDQLMGHMPEIKEFYLYSTNLTTVPGNLFANMSGLQTLNLHLNDKLRDLPSDLFCCLPHLLKLSLKSNNLHYLHPQLFSKLTTLGILLLNNNKLENLPENIFSSNTALKSLTLSGNPWDCTCRIRGIARWVRHNEHVVVDKEDVICHSPVYQLLRTLGSLRDEEFNFCTATRVPSNSPTHSDVHEPTQPFHSISTRGQRSASTTTPPMTTSSTTQGATQRVTIPATTKPANPTTLGAKKLLTSLHTVTTALPIEEPLPSTKTHSTYYMSPPFYDLLVVEQGPEFVHHNFHRGWVYVWFLPSDKTLAGFLMFSHILLVATGLSLILFAMYGMYRLNKTIDKLKTECAHYEG
ncbi:platelet glycoprotein V [Toxotes jaculatrix]|uniref:platelet glycoprotein V n=1 Tax=Toxotes jaculatrix TaxID=941984 RepID=UPI001B3AF5FA|nr:platelet glycoprotein V [Toxotes jaculatrix]